MEGRLVRVKEVVRGFDQVGVPAAHFDDIDVAFRIDGHIDGGCKAKYGVGNGAGVGVYAHDGAVAGDDGELFTFDYEGAREESDQEVAVTRVDGDAGGDRLLAAGERAELCDLAVFGVGDGDD